LFLYFVFETGFAVFAWADLISPASASQVAGITDMYHHIWMDVAFIELIREPKSFLGP
jgi:hypothetical protein